MTDAVVNLLHMSDINGLLGTRFVFYFLTFTVTILIYSIAS